MLKQQEQRLTLINEYQAQVISGRVLLVDFSEGGCQVETAKEQPNRNRLAYNHGELGKLRGRDWRGLPRDGEPSMISKRTSVSLSLYWFGGAPVVSLRMMESSMCLIFSRTSRKYILPTMTSLRWYFDF